MDLCVYAHPWDLRDLAPHGGLPRLRELGFQEVALAVAYHAGRWLTPWSGEGLVRFLEDGTVHFRPQVTYGELRPLPSSEVRPGEPSPLERLCAEAPAAGLRARAWAVFHHNSRLGRLHPASTVQNCLGDRYRYALCPARPEVQDYTATMVRDLLAHLGLAAIELEGLGWMGWKHSSHHEKASFAPAGLLELALSACFCERCEQAYAGDGHDPALLRAFCTAETTRLLRDGDAMAPAVALSEAAWRQAETEPPLAFAVPSTRASVMSALARRLREHWPQGIARAVQVHPSRWFAGSQLPVAQAQGLGRDDEFVLTAYGESLEGIERLLTMADMHLLRDRRKRLCIWPKAPQFRSDDDLRALRASCGKHGITALSIYHLGLLPWRTLERVAKVLAG